MPMPDEPPSTVAPEPTFPALSAGGGRLAWLSSPPTHAVPLLWLGIHAALAPWLPSAGLEHWLPGGKWISPNSGACLTLAALALLAGRVPTRRRLAAMRFLGLLLLGDGALILLHFVTAGLMPAALEPDAAGPAAAGWAGNPSVMSAIAWIGGGLFFLHVRHPRHRVLALSAMLLVGAMGLIGLLGWSSGAYSQYFIASESAVTSLPTALALLLLTVGMAAFGMSCGGWRWFLRRRPDRRLAILGGIVLAAVSLASGVYGVSLSARTVVAQQEAELLAGTRHMAEDFRRMVRQSARDLEQRADAAFRAARSAPRDEEKLRAALERLHGAGDGPALGLHWEPAGRPRLSLGRPPPDRAEFDAPWSDGAPGRLVWDEGLALVLERPLADGGRLVLVGDLDAAYRHLQVAFAAGRSREVGLCAAGPRQGTATCLPSRSAARVATHELTRQGQPLPMAQALAGKSGVLQTADYRGVRVMAAHVPLDEGLGLVAKTDLVEAMAPVRRQIWIATLVILGLTLLGGLLFQRIAHAQVHALMRTQSGSRALFDHAPVGVIEVDDRGLIRNLNPQAEAMFGHPRHKALGMSAARLFDRGGGLDEEGGFRPPWGGARRLAARRRDGGGFDVEVVASRFWMGDRWHLALVVTDVTARLRHERELARWEQVFSHAGWGIVIGSADGSRLEQMNPHFARMHGYGVEELTGRPIAWVFASAARAALGAHIALAHSRGHHSFESMHVRKDGTEFPVFVDVSTVRDESGAVRFRVVNVQDITERKAMEQALRNAESAQRAMLDNLRDPLFRWRPDFTLEYANPAFAAIFGRLAVELLGRNWLDLLPGATREAMAKRIEDLVANPRRLEYEAGVRREGGEQAWFVWTHAPLWAADGRLLGFQSRAYDITACKEAELTIAESKARLQALFDGRLQPTCLLAKDGTVIQMNRAMLALAGEDDDALLKLQLWQGAWCRGQPETVERLRAAVADAARGLVGRLEAEIRDRTGRPAIYEIVCSPVRDETGSTVTMVIAEARDVSEARCAERAVMEREARLQALADSLPGMLFEFRVENGEPRPTYVSDGVGDLCGLCAADLVSGARRLVDCVHPEDRPRFTAGLAGCAALTMAWHWTGRLVSPHRSGAVWVDVRAKPRVAGKRVTWDAVALDITALKEKELEIAASREALRDLSAHRETVREDERKYIAREIHDELGQNLTALRMGLAVLEARGAAQPGGEENRGEIARLKELADKAIGVVRSVATSLRPAALDMGLAAALTWLADEFDARNGIACTLDLSGAPGGLNEEIATGLFRIVQESLTNVARHADARKVHIMLRRLGHHLALEVRDDGIGFEAGGAGQLKGYGLLGMRERALMLNGRISVVGMPGQGTVVSVSIPLEI